MQIGLIGAGNMARALARGWGEPVLVSDAGSGRAQALVEELGGEALTNAEVARRAELVVLCHKPAQLDDVAAEISGAARAVASVVGGPAPRADLQQAYGDTPTFQFMPNTPVEVRRGVVLYVPAPEPPVGDAIELEARVLALFRRLGTVVAVPDRLLAAAAALMSVAPAYWALLVEAQVDAGVRHGVGAQLASLLVTETMAGSAALLAHRGHDTLAVRREVTSPGGTTARGLAVLEARGIRSAFQDAIDAVLQAR